VANGGDRQTWLRDLLRGKNCPNRVEKLTKTGIPEGKEGIRTPGCRTTLSLHRQRSTSGAAWRAERRHRGHNMRKTNGRKDRTPATVRGVVRRVVPKAENAQ